MKKLHPKEQLAKELREFGKTIDTKEKAIKQLEGAGIIKNGELTEPYQTLKNEDYGVMNIEGMELYKNDKLMIPSEIAECRDTIANDTLCICFICSICEKEATIPYQRDISPGYTQICDECIDKIRKVIGIK